MKNIALFFQTIRHLKFIQVFYQVKYRLIKPSLKDLTYGTELNIRCSALYTEPIVKPICLKGKKFTFLNLGHQFDGWDYTENGMLWAYNQNYFDWLGQEGMTEDEGCKWIDKFIAEVKGGFPMDPYPIALRSINWVKFFCKYPESATEERVNALYSQVKLLEKKLEYHLLGNHLLEDAYALYLVGSWFKLKGSWFEKAKNLLLEQLKEQILADGAHYEQSPMYHCILLDRLLDCINISKGSLCEKSQENLNQSEIRELENNDISRLCSIAEHMLGHLESVKWSIGSIPMLNDSANGIAPITSELFSYAKRLGLKWKKIPMKKCGYRKMVAAGYEAIVDVGNIAAINQPGHTHADTFNYELHIDGKPFVVDTGISTYNKTDRRQLERSTVAHNCVSPDGMNSSEVWGGFRVGKRCRVKVESLEFRDESQFNVASITASHDGYRKPCTRRFEMNADGFTVEDWYDGEAISYIHLAKDTDVKRVNVEGALNYEIKPWKYSVEYNQFVEGKVMEIRFKGHCKYIIQ